MTTRDPTRMNLRPAEAYPDPRRRLAEIVREQVRLAAEAEEIMQAMAEDTPDTRASVYSTRKPHVRAADLLDSARAEKLTGVSRSTLVRAARRDPALGWRTPGGSWRFVRRELLSRFNSPRDENARLDDFAEPQCLFESANQG